MVISLKPWDKEFMVELNGNLVTVESMVLYGVTHFRINWLDECEDLIYYKEDRWCTYTGMPEKLLLEIGKVLECKMN